MAYREQLVIRTRDPAQIRVLERVKEIAGLESKTISDKAVELMARGLGELLEPAGAAEQEEEEAETSRQRGETIVRREPEPLSPPRADAKPASVRPTVTASEAARRAAEEFASAGPSAAAQTLTDFFARAEPVDGAEVREQLQERLSSDAYDAILEELKQTDEYRAYRRRVVYAGW